MKPIQATSVRGNRPNENRMNYPDAELAFTQAARPMYFGPPSGRGNRPRKEAVMTKPRFFRHSPWDAIPAACTVAIVALSFWTFLNLHSLPWWGVAIAFAAVAVSYCWNLQCLSHNFIHNPFFAWPWFNRAFSILETIALGVPHSFYHHYHLNHHW